MKELCISLGEILDIVRLERLLRTHYAPSLRKIEAIEFNAETLAHANLFTLGIVMLWVKRLRSKGKQVRFTLGKPAKMANDQQKRMFALLYRWRIIEALKGCGAVLTESQSSTEQAPLITPSQRSVIGLHFFEDLGDVARFIKTIGAREQELFSDFFRLELIGSGALRNIILQELLSNVFEHGDGISGFTAMSEHTSPWAAKGNAKAIVEASPHWEQSFLSSLQTKSYLEIVVADHGPGILKTLASTWSSDGDRINRHETQELNVIEYSFGKHVSRKADPTSYLRDVIQRAEGMSLQTITGLYFVKCIAAQHRGLLAVRSGASWLSWDFSDSEDARPQTHRAERRIGKMQDFGGCQFRILFPLGEPDQRTRQFSFHYATSTSKQQWAKAVVDGRTGASPLHRKNAETAVFFDLSDMVTQSPIGLTTNEWMQYAASARRSYFEAPENCWFITVLSGGINTKRDILVLLYLLIDLQESSKPILLLTLGDTASLVDLAAKEITLDPDKPDLPLVCLDGELALHLVGGGEKEEAFVQRFFTLEGVRRKDEDSRGDIEARRLRHIIQKGEVGGEWQLRIALSLEEVIRKSLQLRFQRWSGVPPAGICRRGRFLLPHPSNAYCENFWEVGEITGIKERSEAAVLALVLVLLRESPEFLVALSSNAGILARQALRWLGVRGRRGIQLSIIDNPHSSLSFLGSATRISDGSTILITDVIGTGKVIDNAIRLEAPRSVKSVVAIVDAREEKHGRTLITPYGELPVSALIRAPQKYFTDLPIGWSYSEIQTIDLVLHKPIASKPLEVPGVLWGEDLDKSLRQCAASGALDCGHFSTGSRHFSTFVLTSRLIRQHRDEIVGAVISSVESASGGLPEGQAVEITHAIYNEESAAAGQVCTMIAEAKESCKVVPVSVEAVRSRNIFAQEIIGNARDVIVIEPAASSGDTARILLAYAAQMKPRTVFFFILAERLSEVDAWLFSKINFINEARVQMRRFLSLASRAYTHEECPQCLLLREYEQVLLHVSGKAVSEYARERRQWHLLKPISAYRDPEKGPEMANSDLLWAETAMTSRLHSAKDNLALRHSVAQMLTTKHDNSMHCCGMILAMAREASLFRSGDGLLREVLYPSLQQKIFEACLCHIYDRAVATEVLTASIVVLLELAAKSEFELEVAWWDRIPPTESNIVAILGEICKWALRGKWEEGILKRVEHIIEKLTARSRANGTYSSRLSEARTAVTLLTSASGSRVLGSEAEGSVSAWQACSKLLKRHGHVAAALDGLSATISISRTTQELREFYERSWVERVRQPIEEVLLPSLARLQQSGLPKIHSRAWPLESLTLGQLRASLSRGEAEFLKIIETSSFHSNAEEAFQTFLEEVEALRRLLLGEDSAFSALLYRLVIPDTREIAAHFRGAAESLRAQSIECSLEVEPIPTGLVVFVSPADLLTCLEALVRNVQNHAFPSSYAGKRTAEITARVNPDSQYVVTVKDFGVGLRPDWLSSGRDDNGLVMVRRFAESYGADLAIDPSAGGCSISIAWALVEP